MIYGEETLELNMSGGLWESDAIESVPEGFCSKFQNALVDDFGNILPMKAFQACPTTTDITPVSLIGNRVDIANPYYILQNPSEPRMINLGGYGYNSPTALNRDDDTLQNYRTLSLASNEQVSFVLAQTYHAGSWCMYRDRIYACDSNSLGVHRITGWNFAGVTVPLETAIAGSPPNLYGMLFHKSRLFGWIDNRLYWTDEITVGGYPETWNIATNFVDLPSDSSPSIHNIHILNNTLYLMTEDGVYTLQVYGPPTSWVFKKINGEIKTYSIYESILTSTGLIFYTDRKSVFAYNGETTTNIGGPVTEILEDDGEFPIALALHPFEKGFLLTVQQHGKAGTPLKWIVQSSRVIYFTGTHWTEIVYYVAGVRQNILSVESAIANKIIPNWCYTVNPGYGSLVNSFVTFAYGPSHLAVTLSMEFYGPGLYDTHGDVIIEVPVRKTYTDEKRFKYGYIDLMWGGLQGPALVSDEIYKADIVQGVIGSETRIDPDAVTPYVTIPDNNYLIKFSQPQFARRLSVKLRFKANGDVLNTRYPWILKKLGLVFNTGRKEPDGVS